MYCSIPGKCLLPGKHPGTAFQGCMNEIYGISAQKTEQWLT